MKKEITIPISVVYEITKKYNIKDGKIVFTKKNMTAKEFASKILTRTITKQNLKNFALIKVNRY